MQHEEERLAATIGADARYRYRVFGLSVASEIVLTDLAEAADAGPADVFVRAGSIPVRREEPPGLSVSDEGALLNIEGVGRYLMRGGREMVVDAHPDATSRNVRLYLLGSALGAILHQRGLLPLHANAVEIDGRAVAFMGHSGVGKSTMAAWFHDHGFPILADDVCVVTYGSEGLPMAHPGIPRLRLWKEALEGSGREAADYERSFETDDKYDIPTKQRDQPPQAIELAQIYLLKRGEPEGTAAVVKPLVGVEAVDALVANTYRGSYVRMMGGTGRHLRQCLELVRKVPVFSAERPWRLAEAGAQARLLEEHARRSLSEGMPRPV